MASSSAVSDIADLVGAVHVSSPSPSSYSTSPLSPSPSSFALYDVALGVLRDVPPLVLDGGRVVLAPHSFRILHASLLSAYMKSTREWALAHVSLWLGHSSSPSTTSSSSSSSHSSSFSAPSPSCQLLSILGSAGTGKSVLSAILVPHLSQGHESVLLAALHFCRHDNASASSPVSLLSSLAAQLAATLPPFGLWLQGRGASVAATLEAGGDTEDLFEVLIAQPLRELSISARGRRDVVIIIDALDELPSDAFRHILNLLSRCFVLLPHFVRLIVTSREQVEVKRALVGFKPLELVVDELHNRQDMRKFMSSVASDCVELIMTMKDVAEKVAEKWKGIDVAQLSELEGPLTSSKLCYDVAADRISRESGYKKLCAIAELRPDPPLEQAVVGQGIDDRSSQFNVLVKDAGDARTFLKALVADKWEPKCDKPSMQVPVKGSTRRWVENAIDPGIKGEKRAKEKCVNDYNGNVLLLKDLARISLEYSTCDNMYAGYVELQKCQGVELVSVKNKFANPTPMGYRDLNLGVRVTLPGNRKHICEVQMNLVDMLKAKHDAHRDYEVVRSKLPEICKSAGGTSLVNSEDVEEFVMDLLHSSVLDSAVKDLEEKAGGLFIYARLLEAQLKEIQRETGGKKVDFTMLKALPRGLWDMYQQNFFRTFPRDLWDSCKRIVALITVAEEPLPVDLVEKVVGVKEYAEAADALSLLFPERDGTIQVTHKSVVDWLKDENRTGHQYSIGINSACEANNALARALWSYRNWQLTDNVYCYQDLKGGEMYALKYGLLHWLEALNSGEEESSEDTWNEWENNLFYIRAARRRYVQEFGGEKKEVSCSVDFTGAIGVRPDDFDLKVPGAESRDGSGEIVPTSAAPFISGNCCDYEESEKCASEAAGRLLSVHAKLGRIKAFASELRALEDVLDNKLKRCYPNKTALKLLAGEAAWLLANEIIPRMRDTGERGFRVSCANIANAPLSSPWFQSAGSDYYQCQGEKLLCLRMTLPLRLNISPILLDIRGHEHAINAVAFSSDGTKLYSASLDKSLRVWSVSTGDVIHSFHGHADKVTSLAVHFDGKNTKLVSGSYDETAIIWDESGECLSTLSGHAGWVMAVAFSQDGRYVLTGSVDERIKLWNAATGNVERTLKGHQDVVTSVSFFGEKVLSSSYDRTIKIWDSTTGKAEKTLKGHTDKVLSVVASSCGKFFCSASKDATIKLWNSITGLVERTLVGHTSDVLAVAASIEGKLLSSSEDCTVRVWDSKTGDGEQTFQGHSRWVLSVAWSADCSKIASGSGDGSIKIWDARSGKRAQYMNGHLGWVAAVALSGDESKIASGSGDQRVMVWETDTGKLLATLHGQHTHGVTSLAMNISGSTVVSGSYDKTVRLYLAPAEGSFRSYEHVRTFADHSEAVLGVALSCDESRIASASADNTVKVWCASTGHVTSTMRGHCDRVTAVAFNHDGTLIASGSDDKTVKVWNAATGDCERTFTGHTAPCTTVSWRSGILISGSLDATVRRWNAETGSLMATLQGPPGGITSSSVSGDGTKIVTGTHASEVHLWDATNGLLIQSLHAHKDFVQAVALNRDGSLIVSSSIDKTIKIWGAASAQEGAKRKLA